ncbi:hypothetical protein ALNOE001_15320 [Candidatus Methanobinarius endosymbioticus]|uniref:Uncharacterized protein n=1 Tax=Candidatus Methanobinarius endosymbioticus TaxID=2006182 RepID=A0A366M9B7_9EURY|nr:hypothetical protein ALNOE001_15320 [Candidatus Methanobinarius endosymbioticus]
MGKLSDFSNVNLGLTVENSFDKIIINTMSFEKLKILENDNYNNLIGKKII